MKYQVIIKDGKDRNLSPSEVQGLLPPSKYDLVLYGNGNETRAAFNVNTKISEDEVRKDLTTKWFQKKPSIELYCGTERLN